MKLLILTQKVDINDDVLGFFHGWIAEFAKHCKQVTVICLYKGEYDLPENVKVLSLGKEKFLNCYIAKLLYCWNFFKFIWQERKNYDQVFVHMNQIYVVLGGVFWRAWHKKQALWYTHKQVSLSLRIAEKLVDTIFTASKESFRLDSDKVKVMGHGINTDIFKPYKNKKLNNKFTILTVGRISPIKDLKTLVRAVGKLQTPNYELQIVGKAGTVEQEKYFQEVKDLVKKEGIENKVKFIGSIPNREVLKYYQRADLFVNMSQTGSLDKVVLEAMACEIPVITCNEALADLLKDYSDILRCEKENVDELKNRIEYLLSSDYRIRNDIGNNLRKIVVERNNLNNLIKNILES